MNNDKKITVALIFGGRGYESEVSLSGRDFVLPILEKKYNCLPIFIDKAGRWMLENRQIFPAERGFITEGSERIAADCAIPLLHGDYGEDGSVQGALETARIAYIGCDTSASAVCRDKFFVKRIAIGLGIPTLPCVLALRCEGVDFAVRQAEGSIGYPLFVKPTRLGSSVGAGAADNKAELETALNKAFSLCDRVIIEPRLTDKRELECGYFSAKGKEIFTYPAEVLIKGSYGYEEKYLKSNTRLSVRADLDAYVAESVREYSRRLTRALGVRDISRIDYFLSGGELYLNEINTFPGFTSGSLYPRLIEAAGIPIGDALDMLIEQAVDR